jgi:hypothetical protein
VTTGQPTAENGDAGAPSGAQEKPLRESLEDASVLLWYATREGKQVSKETIGDIVEAQSSLIPGTRNPPLESRFWVALRELAAAVQPASVDSILATYSYPFGDYGRSGKRRLTDAADTKKRYSVISIIVLGLLLVVQIYWFIGTTWRTDLETNRAELDRIAGFLREMVFEPNDVDDFYELKNRQIDNTIDKTRGETNSEEQIIEDHLKPSKSRQNRVVLQYANVTLRGDRVKKMLSSNSRMLDSWEFFTEVFGTRKTQNDGVLHRSADTEGPKKASGASFSPSSMGAFNRGGYQLVNAIHLNPSHGEILRTAEEYEEEHLGVEDTLVNSKSMLAIISQYLLPLLYGWLGALAYILRTLSREIQEVTFTRGSEIRYSLRWPLGMLGGVTVGLFFEPADLTGFAAITPLGLAFLAGYGVELLFTGLDRIVRAFTSEDTARPKVA